MKGYAKVITNKYKGNGSFIEWLTIKLESVDKYLKSKDDYIIYKEVPKFFGRKTECVFDGYEIPEDVDLFVYRAYNYVDDSPTVWSNRSYEVAKKILLLFKENVAYLDDNLMYFLDHLLEHYNKEKGV